MVSSICNREIRGLLERSALRQAGVELGQPRWGGLGLLTGLVGESLQS